MATRMGLESNGETFGNASWRPLGSKDGERGLCSCLVEKGNHGDFVLPMSGQRKGMVKAYKSVCQSLLGVTIPE